MVACARVFISMRYKWGREGLGCRGRGSVGKNGALCAHVPNACVMDCAFMYGGAR